MKRIVVRASIAILSSMLLLLLLFSFSSPLLFSPENLSSTPYHVQIQSQSKISNEESAQVLPLMQDMLSGTSTITISLQAKDFPAAERDLQTYLDRSSHLENLIIQLNLSDTDLESFRQENEEDLVELSEMLNLTERFSALDSIEVNYRDEQRPDLLYSVSYEGETIKNRVAAVAQDYASRKSQMLNTSQSFGLNSTGYEQSVTTLSAVSQEVVVHQTDRAVSLENVIPSPYLLTLQLQPSTVGYGDEITFSGSFVSGPSSVQAISLYIDSILWKETAVDAMGGYGTSYPVQHIRAGTHIAYALYEHTYSEIRTFTVRSQPTRITLVPQITDDRQIICTGTLFSGNSPVASAPVELSSDGKPILTVYTDAQGSFTSGLDLSSAEHRIKARFTSPDFPLDPSEVEILVAPRPDVLPSLPSFLFALAAFVGCAGGAGWFLLRRRPRPHLAQPSAHHPPSVPPLRESPLADLGMILTSYWELLLHGEVQEGAHLLYRTLVDSLARLRGIPHAPSLTPRELAGKVPDLSPDLPEFVDRYEKIRYAGLSPTEKEHETLTSRFLSLIRFIRGGFH
jgi:hypothetical protein